ncbi:MAG: hypothetical protein KKB31_00475 [Nanoarchaeota archaeon]|nr:hypothetical protein [Nanoarchaeota archaeon]
MGKHRLIFLILASILLIQIARAESSVISLNPYGSEEGALLPDEIIEGFFFAEQPSGIPPSGGGGATPEVGISQDDYSFLCNYSYDFIQLHTFNNTLNYTNLELILFRNNLTIISKNFGLSNLKDFFGNFTTNCQELFKKLEKEEIDKKPTVMIILLIILSVIVFLAVYLRDKLCYLAMVISTKSRNLRRR